MGWSSYDDFISEITAGKSHFLQWNKITGANVYTAGRFYDMSILAGHPIANSYTGTALAATQLTDLIAGAPYHGGDKTPDTKHILSMSAVSAVATFVPGFLLLCDFLLFYPTINMNLATLQTLTNVAGLSRYTDGKGVRAFLMITGASGATPHNFAMTYTDDLGNTGNVLPVTVACTVSAIAGHVPHSGLAVSNFGPFLPLAAGDNGIRSVQDVQLSAASGAGTAALVLARPLARIPILAAGVASERELMHQLPSLPRIYDGAYLGFLFFAGAAVAASSNIYGDLEFGWG